MQIAVGPIWWVGLLSLGLVGAVTAGERFAGRRRLVAAYAGAVALAVVARVPYATLTPSHDDSAIYLADVERIALEGSLAVSELEHLGVELVMALFYLVFGQSGPNLALLAAVLATVPAMGLAARSLFDSERAGIATAFVVVILPLDIFYSSRLLMEPISLLVLVGTLYTGYGMVVCLDAIRADDDIGTALGRALRDYR
ncbi:hypothetical protein GJ629_01840 [Halapricum sp. CBA1109]|uniref:hypothetical protein n=1 Tax=Halapricum sp. CBA1109 TaxID=2668068 RepID=UPI0012F9B77A|nr:hypothetical protein [Halapricum sp. CBA1109]MUV88781.1 hypothetical protein [Halapricum sp. CBA1109]